jgi:hypothetical protein
VSKPPSRWYSSGCDRGKTHDQMQTELLSFLRSRKIWTPSSKTVVAIDRVVEGEYAFTRRGEVVAFADAIEILTIDLFKVVNLFEVKPKIESVFAVIRQATALLELAKSSMMADLHYCNIVVPAADPLLPELRVEWPHAWGWSPGAAAPDSWAGLEQHWSQTEKDHGAAFSVGVSA